MPIYAYQAANGTPPVPFSVYNWSAEPQCSPFTREPTQEGPFVVRALTVPPGDWVPVPEPDVGPALITIVVLLLLCLAAVKGMK